MSKPPPQPASRTAGFTLLEMMITLAIFLLLAAAVFGTLTGVLQSTASLHDNQDRRDQIVALNNFLKKKLGELPAQSSLISYRRGDGEGLDQNGIILGGTNEMAIDAKIQPNGLYTLRVASEMTSDASFPLGQSNTLSSDFIDSVTKDTVVGWTPLIVDIKTISWKFEDLGTTQWSDQWENPNFKPNLVAFSVQLAGDLQPVTMNFWIPRLAQISIIAPQSLTPASAHAP